MEILLHFSKTKFGTTKIKYASINCQCDNIFAHIYCRAGFSLFAESSSNKKFQHKKKTIRSVKAHGKLSRRRFNLSLLYAKFILLDTHCCEK